MDKVFIARLILSFFVGGFYIVFIARLAEMFGAVIGGALATTPSTILIGNIFVGVSEGKQALYDSVSGTIMALCFTFVLLMVFVTVNRTKSFLFSISVGLVVWLVFAGLNSMASVTVAYASSLYCLFLTLSREYFDSIPIKKAKKNPTTKKALLFRMVFAGSVVVSIMLTARLAGGFWGGIVAGFPVMFLSSIYILNKNQGKAFTASFIKVLPFSSISVFFYLVTVAAIVQLYSLAFTIFLAFIVSITASVSLFKFREYGQMVGKYDRESNHQIDFL